MDSFHGQVTLKNAKHVKGAEVVHKRDFYFYLISFSPGSFDNQVIFSFNTY